MNFRLCAVALVLSVVAAAPVRAQGDRGSSNSNTEKPHIVTADSVERLNPITPLIEHRHEIGIPDSLIGKLGAILSQLDAKNARALRQIDSLAAHPGGTPTISDEALREGAGQERRAGIVTLDVLIGEITKNNDDAGARVLQLLPDKAASRALKYMNRQRQKLKQLLFDSGVGRARGG